MARKRLSDLLREEANKSPADASLSETPANESHAQPAAPASTKETHRQEAIPDAEATEHSSLNSSNGTPAGAIAAAPSDPATSRRHSPTKAELEATIAELRSTLQQTQDAAQQQEATLQQQITHLTSELASQQALIEQLQTEVQQVQSLKAQLEEARKVILQLSQVNAQPAPPLKASPASPGSSPAAEPELETTQPVRPVPKPTSTPSKHQIALRQMLAHPTQPGSLPKMSSEESKLSETDMGWVD
ncbi:MAG: hypothetical protein IGS50_02370 [Synechococcales cyanobacterium C42_A2020_086]|jgi:multidrug efflux pump subunit AcrA (membrane-fusion protein)|nr:hypothetical protein [Synechococcales cyanobacterium C42_A2020_086]